MFYVYALKSLKDGSIYIGCTNNLRRRVEEHNKGEGKSTKHRAPFELIYYEAYKSEKDAKYREHNLKRFAVAHHHLKKRIANSLA